MIRKEIKQAVDRMIKEADGEMDGRLDVVVEIPKEGLRDFITAARLSARMEMELGEELKIRNRGVRSPDGSVTIWPDEPPKVITLPRFIQS